MAGCSGSVTGSANSSKPPPKPADKPKLDARRLERAIAVSAEAQRHQKTAVICPAKVSVPAGSHFYCAAQAGGEVTPFLVTAESGGRLVYKGVSRASTPSVNMAQTEIAIAQAMRTDHEAARSVSCPQAMPLQQGLEFVCVATTGARHTTDFLVRETNSAGSVSFKPRCAGARAPANDGRSRGGERAGCRG